MSRARTQRRKAARRDALGGVPMVAAAARPGARALSVPAGEAPEGGSRLQPARRRAARAKLALCVTGAVVFAVAMALARIHYPGHTKGPLRTLAAPPAFVRVVRQSALEAGILAPAEAPPDAATSQS